MTNKEKAEQIGKTYSSAILQGGAYFGAMEMAKWKEQQFKKYLEKKKFEYGIDYSVNALELLDEIINELFKEE